MLSSALLVASIGAGQPISLGDPQGLLPAAYTNCDPSGNYQEGYVSSSGSQPMQYEGASAQLTYEFGNICTQGDTTGNNVSTAWTMVFSNDAKGWAQSGLLYIYGWSYWHHFAQQEYGYPTNTPATKYGSCVNQGEVHQAWQQLKFNGTSYYMSSNIDTTPLLQSSWDPLQHWTQPFYVEFDGETHHDNSDIPGYSSTRTVWSSMQVQNYANDSWYSVCSNVNFSNVVAARYSEATVACNQVQAWTSG
jgi:hypothetical protein